jgi:hypothetical protein
LKKLIRENTIKALIAATVASGVGYEGTKVIQDMFPQGKEIIIETSKLPFEKHHLSFRDDNPDFFADKFGDTLHKETIAKGITIIRDAGLTFYVLQPEDCTKKLL